MKPKIEARFITGPEGTRDQVAEKIKAVEIKFMELQRACAVLYAQNTKNYWEEIANMLFSWSKRI